MATKKAPRKLRREPMSRVDTAWLRMERPTNPMMITGVLMLDEPMTLETLKKVIGKRFLAFLSERAASACQDYRGCYSLNSELHGLVSL